MLRLLRPLLAVAAFFTSAAHAAPDKVVPYAGVIDRNGVPFSGVATLNFALFNCPQGNCANAVQLWQASGSGTFPSASAAGIAVTANGGKFSVLLGDTGQAALPADVWRSTQLHVRIAVKGGTTWVPLTGFQRVAPSASAISAEEAASFTIRQDLSVGGNAIVTGNINVGSLNNRGAADIDGNLNVDGTTTFQQSVIMNNRTLQLRSSGDGNHRLVHGTSFGGFTVDGPQLIGFGGGILGTSSNNRTALQWDAGGVTINGNAAVSGSVLPATIETNNYRRKGDDLFVVCERATTGGRGAGQQSILFDENSYCGGHTLPFGSEWVGALSVLDICGQANNVDVVAGEQNAHFPQVRWFQGSGCGSGSFRVRAIYMRIK